LIGYILRGEIFDCYATGNVSAAATASSSPYDVISASVGGLIGMNYGGYSTVTNSYKYSAQIFTRRTGSATYATPNNVEGSACAIADLNNISFFISTLDWDSDIWDFSDLDFLAGKMPVLKI